MTAAYHMQMAFNWFVTAHVDKRIGRYDHMKEDCRCMIDNLEAALRASVAAHA